MCPIDGYMVDMVGPYLANQNDGKILTNIVKNLNDLCKFLK